MTTSSDDKENERLNPGASGADRNNATDKDSAAIPGGSNEDLKGRRGRTAEEQAGHGRNVAEDTGRGSDKPL